MIDFVSLTHKRSITIGKTMAPSCDRKGGVCVEDRTGLVYPASMDCAEEACEALRAGKVIAVPTDTLYGLTCDAWYVLGFFFGSSLP